MATCRNEDTQKCLIETRKTETFADLLALRTQSIKISFLKDASASQATDQNRVAHRRKAQFRLAKELLI